MPRKPAVVASAVPDARRALGPAAASKSAKTAPRKVAKSKGAPAASGPAQQSSPKAVAQRIRGAGDWRSATVEAIRRLILQADSDVVEEVKWRKPSNAMLGVPVWSREGIVCTGEPYKDKVKLTFARGASLPDPTGLFNADDRGHTRRSIDLREGDTIDAEAFTALVRAAIAQNVRSKEAV